MDQQLSVSEQIQASKYGIVWNPQKTDNMVTDELENLASSIGELVVLKHDIQMMKADPI